MHKVGQRSGCYNVMSFFCGLTIIIHIHVCVCVCVCEIQAHNEEHTLQRGGSVSHRRAQSDCLQNRLPITQHFGRVRYVPKQPTHLFALIFYDAGTDAIHTSLIFLLYCPASCIALLSYPFAYSACQSRPRRPGNNLRAPRDEEDMQDTGDPWAG